MSWHLQLDRQAAAVPAGGEAGAEQIVLPGVLRPKIVLLSEAEGEGVGDAAPR